MKRQIFHASSYRADEIAAIRRIKIAPQKPACWKSKKFLQLYWNLVTLFSRYKKLLPFGDTDDMQKIRMKHLIALIKSETKNYFEPLHAVFWLLIVTA